MPIFEAHPLAWNRVRSLPMSDGALNAYLLDWYRHVDLKDRIFVGGIIEQFGERPEGRWVPPVA